MKYSTIPVKRNFTLSLEVESNSARPTRLYADGELRIPKAFRTIGEKLICRNNELLNSRRILQLAERKLNLCIPDRPTRIESDGSRGESQKSFIFDSPLN